MTLGATAGSSSRSLNIWLKELESPIYRKSVAWGMMESKRRIPKKCGGLASVWPVEHTRQKINTITGPEAQTTFVAPTALQKATLEWWGGDMGRKVDKLSYLQNQGQAKWIDINATTLAKMMADFLEDLRLKMYGNGATNGGLYGFDSFTTVSGTSLLANWWAAKLNVTYAGLSCVQGALVNDWTNPTGQAWPCGTGDTGHCYWTPLIVWADSTLFTTGVTHDWVNQWQQALTRATVFSGVLQKSKMDAWVCDPELLCQAHDSLIGKQQLQVLETGDIVKLGHRSLNFAGTELTEEYGVPAGACYGFRWDKLEFRCMQNQLVEQVEEEDIVTGAKLKKLDSYGQFRFKSPACFAKVLSTGAVTT